ncbi:MAG TPA: SDR family NAD(P)-dependent oxidoreductase [Polyangiaceae bacterium]|jgi:NAD(P)-dependent dehydrogenase (short-subunit alcohol dehydrogenase family)
MTDRRTALVTGASRGLGLETCRQLADRGLRVILTSRHDDGAAAAKLLGLEHELLDVSADASVRALTERLRVGDVTLDVLVNNAGISMDGFDARVVRETLDVNFFGAMRVTDALLPLVSEGGQILMVSSGMGELACVRPPLRDKLADPELSRVELVRLMSSFVEDVARGRHEAAGWPSSAYSVSKVGLNALVRILARDLAPHVRVNAVCPGWVRTDMGGPSAERDVATGAASIVVMAATAEGPTGGFFRDGRPVSW